VVSGNLSLDTLDLPVLQKAGKLSITNNPKLSICAADALTKPLPDGSFVLLNSENLNCACPLVACCAGAVCQ
jgi:hypothetical protein